MTIIYYKKMFVKMKCLSKRDGSRKQKCIIYSKNFHADSRKSREI